VDFSICFCDPNKVPVWYGLDPMVANDTKLIKERAALIIIGSSLDLWLSIDQLFGQDSREIQSLLCNHVQYVKHSRAVFAEKVDSCPRMSESSSQIGEPNTIIWICYDQSDD